MLKGIRTTPTLLLLMLSCACFAADRQLPALNALSDRSSISGLSSGAFMAAQFHVAYSQNLIGAGIVAGGPWNCAGTNPLVPPAISAVTTCMNPCKHSMVGCPSMLYPDSTYLADLAKTDAKLNRIDSTENLTDDRIYLFSGKNDHTVVTGVVDTTAQFYRKLGLSDEQIFYNKQTDAGHAFITNNPQDGDCGETEPPYINNCDLPQAERILSHIYGELNPAVTKPTGDLIPFNQTEFFNSAMASMNDTAYVYVPKRCQNEQCMVHIAMHGCGQGVSEIGTTYIERTGYLQVADNNRIIVLYPQVKKSKSIPMNPNGCWDFWGYSNDNLPPYNYYHKDALQMMAIKKMIDRVSSNPADPKSSTDINVSNHLLPTSQAEETLASGHK